MRFDLFTIFPDSFESYLNTSIIKRAKEGGYVDIFSHNIRDYTKDKHKTTDDKPYGGGAGMLMKIEPIYDAVVKNSIYKTHTTNNGLKHAKSQRIVLLSAKGSQFNQKKAQELSKYKQVMLISGRYEGVDERVAEYIADEEISIGPYVLTGGELPSLVIVDAVTRLLPGVLGSEESLSEESFNGLKFDDKEKTKEYPQYTRPEVFSPKKGVDWKVPEVLLSGNHKDIEDWKRKQSYLQNT